ncbi:MAG: YlxM family DNA-binding protein [Ruminococcus sp.]|nr:YlxM family DNA-binding protein [Ruminococcus sp.]
MSKKLEYGVLLGIYGPLLTDKQRQIMELYYDDDLSLGEIADDLGISRQGVHDAIKKGSDALDEYEEKLGLSKTETQRHNDLLEIKELALAVLDECQQKNYARAIAQKTITLLEELDKKLEEYEISQYIDDV